MLLSIVYEHFEGDLCLPTYRSGRNDFVTVVGGLIRRGLVKHDPTFSPAYTATPAGVGMAEVITSACRDMLAMTEGVEKRRKAWKPIAAESNRAKAAWIKRQSEAKGAAR